MTKWTIWSDQPKQGGWGWPKEEPTVVRYRWSPSMNCYVEVVLQNGVYCDGFTMHEGFVPPEGMD